MIGDALRAEIETFAGSKIRENLLFKMAEEGTIDVPCIRAYLTNIHYLLRQTPVCLVRARKRALALGKESLAAHFKQKLEEEAGHFRWAEEDLASLPAVDAPSAGVLPSMQRNVAYLVDTIDEDPTLYLAYILFSEYFTVAVGPEWLRLLEERCGIPRSSMTAIDKHVELDQDHVEEALEHIDDLVGDPTMLPRLRTVLRNAMENFNAFCTELAETHDRVSQPSFVDQVLRSSAA